MWTTRCWKRWAHGERRTCTARRRWGTIRTTFIINEEGIIEQIYAGKQVKTKEHAQQILEHHLANNKK